MAGIADAMPPGPDDLARRVADLEKLVQRLAAVNAFNAATIDKGGLKVINGGSIAVIDPATGRTVAYLGQGTIPDGSGRTQMVALFIRDDGTPALELADLGTIPGHAHQQALQWFDRSGNIVIADDTLSGKGIAVPYVPFGPFMSNTAPTDTTTSATFTTLQSAVGYWMNPKVFIQILVRSSDATTTGNVRVLDQSNNQIGSTQAVAGNDFKYVNIGPIAMPGNFKDSLSLNIQAQRTAGAGTIGVRGIVAIGIQS
jgi:hypothetical protein